MFLSPHCAALHSFPTRRSSDLATIMFGTNTFLAGYARAAHPYDLRSVRLVVAGAEAVKDDVRTTYMNKFGVRIRSEEHTSELQSQSNLVCRLLLEKKKHTLIQQ